MKPRLACQTYAWQMSGTYVGRLDHIVTTIGSTGFAGVEPETQFLGDLADPERLAAKLAEAGVELAALTLVEDWLGDAETEAERRRADDCLALLGAFPGTLLNLCQMPTTRPDSAAALRRRQEGLLSCVHAVARRCADAGIAVGYHPNSPDSSIYRTAEDYRVLLDGLDPRWVGWIPDVGHLARAGLDPLAWIRDHRALVNHIHYKDMDRNGAWVTMGAGQIDFVGITRFLHETGFAGWIVVEDESDRAIPEPDQVTREDWTWVQRELVPILEGAR